MNEGNVHRFILTDGRPEYVVVPIEDYHRMIASLEDISDMETIDRALE